MDIRIPGRTKSKVGSIEWKTTINFVGLEEEKSAISGVLPVVIALAVIVGVIAKFAVFDRYQRLWNRESEARALTAELEAETQALDDSKSLTDRFYHFTWSQMNDEEVNRTDRIKAARLVSFISSNLKGVRSYSVSGQILSVQVLADSLQSISRVVSNLENRPIVDSCTVQTAQTGSFENEANGDVEALLVVYLNNKDQLAKEEDTEANDQ
ncbi:MAG: hypothetical protein IJV04_10025 [Lachnospiraceae bacterium]|nr:hypothetical protein [Lachnospiraceae bacterium]